MNSIYATKHSELPEEYHVLKCRIVCGGNQITTAQEEHVTGKEDNTETMLTAATSGVRSVVAYGHSAKGIVVVFEIEGTYVKSKLGGAKTFGRLNKGLWPEWWHSQFYSPVLPIWMAMYGLPRAEFDWNDEFGCTATFIGFCHVEDIEGSMWVFKNRMGIAVRVIYVDDGVIAGPKVLVGFLFEKLQEY